MKKTKKAAHHKTAAKHHPRKHNPAAPGTYTLREVGTKAKAKVSSAARRAVGNFKGLDVMGILKDGFGVGLGLVGTDIVAKQVVDRFLPTGLPAIAKSFIATLGVAGGAIAIGGGRGFTREVAVGSIAGLFQSVARQYMPAGLMAGTDGDAIYPGYWDENGQWVPDQALAGITYNPAFLVPDTSERPQGI